MTPFHRRLSDGFAKNTTLLDAQADAMVSNHERVQHRDQVIETVETAFAGWQVEDLLPHLAELGIPAGRLRTLDEVYDWAQTRSQGLLVDVEHPTLGAIQLPGSPLRFFLGDRELTPHAHGAPPTLGQHDVIVRAWLDEMDAREQGGGR